MRMALVGEGARTGGGGEVPGAREGARPGRGSAIKLLAVDLDGTLLDEDLTIPVQARECLRKVIAGGVVVTLASGRMYRSASRYAAEIGIGNSGAGIPLITYNGAMVREFPGGRVLASEPVPLEPALSVARLAKKEGYELIVFGEDAIYCRAITGCIEVYTSIAGVPPTPLGERLYDLESPPLKMIVFEENPDVMSRIERNVRDLVGGVLEIAFSYPFFLEIMSPKATKGRALLSVASSLGISREETMAIGDSFNDVSMLEAAGVGVAVANAPDEVKARAKYVTSGTRSAGVMEAVANFILASDLC